MNVELSYGSPKIFVPDYDLVLIVNEAGELSDAFNLGNDLF